MQPEQYHFDSVIVVTNPASKNAAVANQRIKELKWVFPGQVQILETDPELLTTRRTILDCLTQEVSLKRSPILAIAGGDGTVNLVLRMLVGPTVPNHVRSIPIVPLGTGNANDLAFMLYDDPADLEEVLHHSRVVTIRPLECRIAAPGSIPERHVAASYISFGAMAHGAHELNKPEVRKHGKVKSWYGDFMPDFLAVRAAMQAPPFKIEQHNKSYVMRDILIGNGGRVAKVGRMPARLDQPELYVTRVEASWIGRSAIPLGAIKLILGMLPGQLLRNQSYRFKALDTVAAQFDGEPIYVPAGSQVVVTHARATFSALATKLPE